MSSFERLTERGNDLDAIRSKRSHVDAEARLANYLMDVPATVSYPTEVFPPRTRAMIEGYNRVYGAAPDHYGLSIITAVAAALGHSINVRIKNDELHPMIFYSIVVARPGSGKTPTINTCIRPIKKRMRRLLREHKQRVKEMKQEHEARGKGADELVIPAAEMPVVISYSIESLYPVLRSTPRGILIHRDEAIAWIKSQDQYKAGGGDEAEFYLTAHNAQEYSIIRKNLDLPIVIDSIQLNFLGGTQPGRLTAFASGSNTQNGGLARLLFSFPDQTEYRPFNEDAPSSDYEWYYERTIEQLYTVLPDSVREGDDPDAELSFEPRPIDLSPGAVDIYSEYYNALQQRTAAEENEVAVDTLVKFRTHSLRLAGALHALEWAEQMVELENTNEFAYENHRNKIYAPISAETMDRALQLAYYHEFTSLKVINAISSPAERLPHGRRAWYLALPDEGTRADALALATTMKIKGLSARTAERLLKDQSLFKYGRGQYSKLH